MKDVMNVTALMFGKASGSNSLSHNQSCTKRARHDKTIRSSSSKGVVALMNGNWAAHVYVNHNCTCIGIFKTEEAEMAYDSVDENGSNSYVLSSGWKDFVRVKDLRSADKVIFFKCELFEMGSAVHTYFAIDVEYNRGKYVIADGEKLPLKEGVQNFGLEQNHSGNEQARIDGALNFGLEQNHSDLNIIT
ncbi:hypothetical protein AgCh_018799 [Apium graveolens]